ncbi:PREDICTED: mas-related G-protein coupled receptor member H-like [Ficedula albicollis]|uniref:G-protein coupled receptors family 1 profile domain-containing protein n=1 Tax=Ficedula albicollis TaxID=59894 RepID=U3KLL6_FICAL|nr:PREDICTED: mas-related G-protein coupled receptor member H-like [Ficedula albicollis]
MEENSTTNFTTNYTVFTSLDLEEFITSECLSIPYSLIGFAGLCLGISLCGLAGNGVVMWFLCFHTKQSPFTVYIVNLAVADFSLLLLFLLLILAFLTIAAFCTPLFPLIHHYRYFVFAVELLCHLFDLSSLGLLAALSVERCISVLCPIWYRCHRPRHLSGIVSGALWALAGVLVSYPYLTFTEDSEIVLAGVVLVISLILYFVMLVSNMFLFLKLRCGSQRWQPGKLFVAILLNVVLFFFTFSIPFCVDIFLNLPDSIELFPENTFLLLTLLDCTLNPVIYVLVGSCRRRRFQRSVRVALRRVFEEKAESDEGSHGPGDTVVEATAV